jgi:GGDEF domain-containing protein
MRAAVAAQQLTAALWEALHDQLSAGSEAQAAALAERIAEISLSVAELARMQPGDPAGGVQVDRGQADLSAPEAHTDAPGDVASSASAIDPSAQAVIVDEQNLAPPIAIRDARHGQDATPWGAVVQRRLDRYLSDRERFAVLLVELLDAERLRLAQSPLEAEHQARDVEAAMVQQLRPADALVRESDGRYWLIAPDTDADAARALAGRIASAARRSAAHRGVPLEVAIGIALCPEHGLEAISLLGHAEVDLYAAQAGGRVISDPDGDSVA